jgi:methyltransferase family protein
MSVEAMWEELQRRWYPGDTFTPDAAVRSYYEQKYAVAARVRPRAICEIGVRAGYSAFAFLCAAPDAVYLGIDNGMADAEAGTRYLAHAQETVLTGFAAQILRADSQRMSRLPFAAGGGFHDLVHVDGEHTITGCLHDLMLGAGARAILVDDFDVPIDDPGAAVIRTACRTFLLNRPQWAADYLPNALVGSLLLRRTE